MNLQASFERKPSDFTLRNCVVEKTVRLSAVEFEAFLKSPYRNYDFITEHCDLMCCDKGVYHCLLVTGEGRNDGVLVEAEGSDYCRYGAYVPNVSAMTSPALQKLNDKLTAAVDYIIAEGTQNTTEGNWIIPFDEIESQVGLAVEWNNTVFHTLEDMICERKEVSDLATHDHCFDVCYYLDYCPNVDCQTEEVPAQAPTMKL